MLTIQHAEPDMLLTGCSLAPTLPAGVLPVWVASGAATAQDSPSQHGSHQGWERRCGDTAPAEVYAHICQ